MGLILSIHVCGCLPNPPLHFIGWAVLILAFIFYYVWIVSDFYCGSYKERRDLILDLIPFRSWVLGAMKAFNKLD